MKTVTGMQASTFATALRVGRMSVLLSACATILFATTACAPTDAPPAATSNLRTAIPSPHDMLAQVRSAGAAPDVLNVTPLRDPQVEDLRARAATLETQSDYAGAAQAIAQALAIVPGDPELLQQAAEYALVQQNWKRAETLAQQSYDRGPKLGALCRRNWTTLRFVRIVHGDANGVQAATQQVAACTVAAPVRM